MVMRSLPQISHFGIHLPLTARTSLVIGGAVALCVACGSTKDAREGGTTSDMGGTTESALPADGTGGNFGAGGQAVESGAGGSSPASGGAAGGTTGASGGTPGTDSGGNENGAASSGGMGSGGDGSGGGPISDVSPSEGCGKAPALASGSIDLQSGGTARKYTLRLPDDYDQDHPYRLILGFHGATGNSGQVAPSYFGLWPLSEGSTIFIAPDAVGGLWSSETDVIFMDDILDQVKSALCIDATRIELEGFSQGGAMAWTLACARPGVYRAAVVHSGGGLARPANCEPIPFLSSLGQSESGGAGQTSNSDFFAMQNGCTVDALPKASQGSHICSDYQDCEEPTRWCDYDGGHTPSPNDAGQANSWMPEEVWDFLSGF